MSFGIDIGNLPEKIKKLRLTERELMAMLERINQEITQTDVEWMHLKSLANPIKETPIENKSTDTHHLKVKDIDDQKVNEMSLNLTLQQPQNTGFDEDEEEVDDEAD